MWQASLGLTSSDMRSFILKLMYFVHAGLDTVHSSATDNDEIEKRASSIFGTFAVVSLGLLDGAIMSLCLVRDIFASCDDESVSFPVFG